MHAGADAYYDAVEALAHMAIALSAVAAWPAVPCNAPWVSASVHDCQCTHMRS